MGDRAERFRQRYGPWAVVTGASSGIGRAVAVELARRCVHLLLAARSEAALQTLAGELAAKHGVEARVVVADLGTDAGVEAVQAAARDLDVGLLVAAAGFGTSGPFLNGDLRTELEMLAVNCRAVVALGWHFGRRLADRGRGGMILFGSIVGFQGVPNAAHYAATKAFNQTLAEGLARELAPRGVDVLSAAPGPVATGFADRAGMRMGNALRPEDVAGPILNALGRKTTVLPGRLTKLLTYSLAPLPRWARVRIMGGVMGGMTKHRQS